MAMATADADSIASVLQQINAEVEEERQISGEIQQCDLEMLQLLSLLSLVEDADDVPTTLASKFHIEASLSTREAVASSRGIEGSDMYLDLLIGSNDDYAVRALHGCSIVVDWRSTYAASDGSDSYMTSYEIQLKFAESSYLQPSDTRNKSMRYAFKTSIQLTLARLASYEMTMSALIPVGLGFDGEPNDHAINGSAKGCEQDVECMGVLLHEQRFSEIDVLGVLSSVDMAARETLLLEMKKDHVRARESAGVQVTRETPSLSVCIPAVSLSDPSADDRNGHGDVSISTECRLRFEKHTIAATEAAERMCRNQINTAQFYDRLNNGDILTTPSERGKLSLLPKFLRESSNDIGRGTGSGKHVGVDMQLRKGYEAVQCDDYLGVVQGNNGKARLPQLFRPLAVSSASNGASAHTDVSQAVQEVSSWTIESHRHSLLSAFHAHSARAALEALDQLRRGCDSGPSVVDGRVNREQASGPANGSVPASSSSSSSSAAAAAAAALPHAPPSSSMQVAAIPMAHKSSSSSSSSSVYPIPTDILRMLTDVSFSSGDLYSLPPEINQTMLECSRLIRETSLLDVTLHGQEHAGSPQERIHSASRNGGASGGLGDDERGAVDTADPCGSTHAHTNGRQISISNGTNSISVQSNGTDGGEAGAATGACADDSIGNHEQAGMNGADTSGGPHMKRRKIEGSASEHDANGDDGNGGDGDNYNDDRHAIAAGANPITLALQLWSIYQTLRNTAY
jgi:hypothetical protein